MGRGLSSKGPGTDQESFPRHFQGAWEPSLAEVFKLCLNMLFIQWPQLTQAVQERGDRHSGSPSSPVHLAAVLFAVGGG